LPEGSRAILGSRRVYAVLLASFDTTTKTLQICRVFYLVGMYIAGELKQVSLEQLSLRVTRAYVFLAHRETYEPFCYFMDRLRDDPNVTHYSRWPDGCLAGTVD